VSGAEVFEELYDPLFKAIAGQAANKEIKEPSIEGVSTPGVISEDLRTESHEPLMVTSVDHRLSEGKGEGRVEGGPWRWEEGTHRRGARPRAELAEPAEAMVAYQVDDFTSHRLLIDGLPSLDRRAQAPAIF